MGKPAFRLSEQADHAATPGRFHLDRSDKCLWEADVRHDLAPKAFAVLDFLNRNPDRLVTHDDILDAVWPNTFVQPEIVKTYIRTLRNIFRDDARIPRFIETRPRSGYRFIGRLSECVGPPGLAEPALSSIVVGRDSERAAVTRALAKAERHARAAVFFTGEAGIGKSALLAQALSDLKAMPGVVTASAYGCPRATEIEPLSLVISLLQDLATTLGGDAVRSVAASCARSWLGFLGTDGLPVLTDSPVKPPPDSSVLLREACWLLERLARDVTVVLGIDDLQWADPTTSAFVSALLRRRYPARILLVASYRQTRFVDRCLVGEAIKGLTIKGMAETVALPALGASAIGEILGAGCSGRLPIGTGSVGNDSDINVCDIARRSGGNPAIAKALAAEPRAVSRPLAQDRTPGRIEERRRYGDAVYGILDLQLDDFGPFLRSTLEAGSVAGRRFCAWAVATMLDAEQASVEDVIARLASSRQFLVLDSWYSLPDGTTTPIYSFINPIQRQYLLDSQAPSRRSERHRRFGQAIVDLWGGDVKEVANDVSYCFSAAGDWSQAIGYARLAASRAVERSSPNEATRILRKALGLSSRLPANERLAIQLPIRRDLTRLGSPRKREDACA